MVAVLKKSQWVDHALTYLLEKFLACQIRKQSFYNAVKAKIIFKSHHFDTILLVP